MTRMKIHDFARFKAEGRKIAMITCYDATNAGLLADSEIDCLLVGDSLAMTIYGYGDTLQADVPMMTAHTGAVRRGNPDAFVVADMPFLSYRKGLVHALEAAGELMKSGASAVKLEGADTAVDEIIGEMIHAGIPVMGHLGLTPQSVNVLGGYRVQGKEAGAGDKIMSDAERLQAAGCFSLVLECVPESLASDIAQKLAIPVIGIGAGKNVDGQVLVIQDLMGETRGPSPKFVRHFAEGHSLVTKAINRYCNAVREESFPSEKESYH